MNVDEETNLKLVGYKKLLCNPKDLEELSAEFPDLTFTPSILVEEHRIILCSGEDEFKWK